MKRYRITKGWHILFKGADGHDTYGIQLTSNCTPEQSRLQGRQHVFHFNDCAFRVVTQEEFLEMIDSTPEEFKRLGGELTKLLK